MKKASYISVLLCLASLFVACDGGWEDYSTDAGDRLAFSADTVAFDTIVSTVNSPYLLFKVYNPCDRPLLIASVGLEQGAGSPFRINVDGRAGVDFRDVEIRSNDSIYVLISACPSESGLEEPVRLTDRVVFETHGIRQAVVLVASAQDAVFWRGRVLEADTVVMSRRPVVVYDSLVVGAGATLEIGAGTRIYMHGNAELRVRGSLKIRGTAENPVLIRGDRFDYLVNVPYDRVPGQWEGIWFGAESYGNEWEYVFIRNGKYGLSFSTSDPSRLKMRMRNVVMTNFKGTLLRAVNCRIEAENCELTNAKDGILDLTGGVYRFTHCTIANYYMSSVEAGWGNSNHATVRLMGSLWNEATGETEYYPVEHVGFYNSIIWGRSLGSSDIVFDADAQAVIVPFFQHCLIPNGEATNDDPADPDAQVVSCLIGEDPKFRLTDSGDLIYDFRLDSLSPARNVADILIAERLPKDINGVDRLSDEGPDMGGYEFVPAGS